MSIRSSEPRNTASPALSAEQNLEILRVLAVCAVHKPECCESTKYPGTAVFIVEKCFTWYFEVLLYSPVWEHLWNLILEVIFSEFVLYFHIFSANAPRDNLRSYDFLFFSSQARPDKRARLPT